MADEQFNPSDHTVAEVNDYLASADETERTRVLDAEAADKGRTGVQAPSVSTEGNSQTVAEAGANAVEASGEAYEKGYHGFVPSRDGDKPEDLTLAAVTKGA